ncbi:MAG: protein kinase [Planctomycetota bacterium]
MTHTSREPLEAGRSLGDYDLVREIGRGSMGIVFEARQRKLNRRVALKVLPPNLTLTERAVQRFRREAESVAMLDHPGIVPIYDASTVEGTYFYAMRFIDGESLAAWSAGEPDRDPRQIARWIACSAAALHSAHEQGVLHRDIKPGNLLIDRKGEVHLTDFGLARIEKGATLTESGALVGTPVYMSPEQISGERDDVDRRTDVYSLGVTMYELLTGSAPFKGKNTQALLRNILEKEPKRPRRYLPSIPEDLEAITLKAMEKSPESRYPSADELAADLRRYLQGESIEARLAGPITLLMRRAKRHKYVTAAVIIALLATIVSVASLTGSSKRIRNVEKTAKQDVDRATLAKLMAEAHQHEVQGQFEEALAALEEAASIESSPELTIEIVDLLVARARKEERNLAPPARVQATRNEAVDRLEQGLLEYPHHRALLIRAGELHARVGHFEDSLARLERATAEGEPTAALLVAWGEHHLRQAEDEARNGDGPGAIACLEKACEALDRAESLDAENAVIFLRRASVWTLWHQLVPEAGYGAKAEADSQRAIDLDKKNPEARIQRSIVLGTLGKAADAANELSLASLLLPYNVQQDSLEQSLRTLAVIVPPEALAVATNTAETVVAASARSVQQLFEEYWPTVIGRSPGEPDVDPASPDSLRTALRFYRQQAEGDPFEGRLQSRVASLMLMLHRLGEDVDLAECESCAFRGVTFSESPESVALLAEVYKERGNVQQARKTVSSYLGSFEGEDRQMLESLLERL